MATTLDIDLYPPIMPDVIPAFLRNSNCRIYFSLSAYNILDDIANVQVTVVNQKTNMSALDPTKFPSGIIIIENILTTDPIDGYPYHIEIKPSYLTDGIFGLN